MQMTPGRHSPTLSTQIASSARAVRQVRSRSVLVDNQGSNTYILPRAYSTSSTAGEVLPISTNDSMLAETQASSMHMHSKAHSLIFSTPVTSAATTRESTSSTYQHPHSTKPTSMINTSFLPRRFNVDIGMTARAPAQAIPTLPATTTSFWQGSRVARGVEVLGPGWQIRQAKSPERGIIDGLLKEANTNGTGLQGPAWQGIRQAESREWEEVNSLLKGAKDHRRDDTVMIADYAPGLLAGFTAAASDARPVHCDEDDGYKSDPFEGQEPLRDEEAELWKREAERGEREIAQRTREAASQNKEIWDRALTGLVFHESNFSGSMGMANIEGEGNVNGGQAQRVSSTAPILQWTPSETSGVGCFAHMRRSRGIDTTWAHPKEDTINARVIISALETMTGQDSGYISS